MILRLSLKRYSFILLVQFFFLVCDLVFNSVGVFLEEKKSITFLYFSQDTFLILSLASLVYSCYSTYVYQAGLTGIINRQFRVPVLITLIYITLSISLHVCTIYHDVHQDGVWPKAITILFVIQKLCKFLLAYHWVLFMLHFVSVCPINVYFYKRSILVISDPRYYENFEWINEQLRQKWKLYNLHWLKAVTYHHHLDHRFCKNKDSSIMWRMFYILTESKIPTSIIKKHRNWF